jgi:acyl dehydratase
MPITPDAVGAVGEERFVTWTSQDSLLYALGVGAGATDPTGHELEFTTENSSGVEQRALPTQVVALPGGPWPDFGDFDMVNLLHGEQYMELHRPLPAAGSVTARTEVAAIHDKGKAALVVLESHARDESDRPAWTKRAGLFIVGEGGWGGNRGPATTWELPDRSADLVVRYDTRPDQALLYRLTGDRNPLHSDPTFAAAAGFEAPILHGLCTFGFTGRALLHSVCESDPARFRTMSGRFKSPVTPGERLDVHMWVDSNTALFQTRSGDRVVLDAGVCEFS